MEGAIIGEVIRGDLSVPVVEMEVPPVTDALEPGLRTRLEALVETVRGQVPGAGKGISGFGDLGISGPTRLAAAATKSLNPQIPKSPFHRSTPPTSDP